MRDDGEIDGRQHGLPRAVVDRLAPEQDLLVALRDDAETQVVDAVQGFGWRLAAVERERRNGGGVVAVGLGKAPDGASQDARRRTSDVYRPCLLGHERSPTACVRPSLAPPDPRLLSSTSETSFQAMNSMDPANGFEG